MQFVLDETQSMIQDSVAAFVRDQVMEQAMKRNEHGGSILAEIKALGELGLLGVLVSENNGGADLGATELIVALEQLAVGDAGLAAVVAEHNVGALGWLNRDDTADKELIGALATGEKIGCSGHIEGPTIGAMYADVCVLPGASCAVIDLREKAEVTAFETVGLRAAGAGRIQADTPAPTAPNAADRTHMDGLMRLAGAAIGVGVGQRALQAGVQYTLERTQFGKPIARFQALQWQTADAATSLNAARLMVQRAAWLHDAGKPFSDAAARAYHLSVTAARSAADKALQMHGGYGYTEDFCVERMYRDAYSLHAIAGRSDLAKIDIAKTLAAGV